MNDKLPRPLVHSLARAISRVARPQGVPRARFISPPLDARVKFYCPRGAAAAAAGAAASQRVSSKSQGPLRNPRDTQRAASIMQRGRASRWIAIFRWKR